jgi:hypothetical protein
MRSWIKLLTQNQIVQLGLLGLYVRQKLWESGPGTVEGTTQSPPLSSRSNSLRPETQCNSFKTVYGVASGLVPRSHSIPSLRVAAVGYGP